MPAAGELVLHVAVAILLPFAVVPAAVAVLAWRRPARGRVLAAVALTAAAALWATYLAATRDPAAARAAESASYAFRVAVSSALPWGLGAASLAWAVAFGTRARAARVVALALSLAVASAGLAVGVAFFVG